MARLCLIETNNTELNMNAKHLIATVAIAFAGSAFAADAPVANAAATAAAAAATTVVSTTALTMPTVAVSAGTQRSRAEVHAEAVQAVKSYKTTLATQLEITKN
jgi:hypothetical protein